ncbi:flagellar basal body-associated FliL family protein [Candidatus Liberibacter asiaticus]|uniref:Uncharacterized protein n=3 Tax=Liberibacter asiaticus TaxID=34021 RepID=C6XF28_LIBAP|nr:flagellar basal body-associated FliL family protein [Candidatus Liberibacter asiaticus]ACT56980.1 hypothetical protein CLIBASIA_01970 [Candidatus Liberibacter asiaticus str. psy62]AGH17054.1 hypothetical protein WSI_03420 [Candidatus Liberibacter asiaticus str. gxpsy]ALK07379.1 hypothetical protein CD16_03445 [Candidatus Liberibacter asiaticus]ASK52870.1 hypothetical protein B2I23_03500 [Candidatus Liberibacter asiaticus]AWL14188.1 hypothetical protein DIC79_03520 [Candidatus Liberibacter a
MLKFLFSGIWISVVTLISFYMLFLRSMDTMVENHVPPLAIKNTNIIKSELVSIPSVSNGVLQAYFLVKLSFIVNDSQERSYLKEIATDYLYTLLSGPPMGDFVQIKAFGFDNLRKKIKEDLNSRLGSQFISEVLIDELNYLSIVDMRSNCLRLGSNASDLMTQKGSLIEKNKEPLK